LDQRASDLVATIKTLGDQLAAGRTRAGEIDADGVWLIGFVIGLTGSSSGLAAVGRIGCLAAVIAGLVTCMSFGERFTGRNESSARFKVDQAFRAGRGSEDLDPVADRLGVASLR